MISMILINILHIKKTKNFILFYFKNKDFKFVFLNSYLTEELIFHNDNCNKMLIILNLNFSSFIP